MLQNLNERLDARRAARARTSIIALNPLTHAQGSRPVASAAGRLVKIARLREARQILELLWEDAVKAGDMFAADCHAKTERGLRAQELALLGELS